MSKKEDRPDPYESNPHLEALAKEILASTEKLEEARMFRTTYLFTNKKMPKGEKAICHLFSEADRFQFGVDFRIIFQKAHFLSIEKREKLALFIHEFHHEKASDDDEPAPKLRDHGLGDGGLDFCELGHESHDKFSYAVADEILARTGGSLPALEAIPHQKTIQEF